MNADVIKERVGNQAGEAVQTMKEKAAEWRDTATENAVNFAKGTDTYFRDNLWTAIGVTAAFAFVVGLVIGSRWE